MSRGARPTCYGSAHHRQRQAAKVHPATGRIAAGHEWRGSCSCEIARCSLPGREMRVRLEPHALAAARAQLTATNTWSGVTRRHHQREGVTDLDEAIAHSPLRLAPHDAIVTTPRERHSLPREVDSAALCDAHNLRVFRYGCARDRINHNPRPRPVWLDGLTSLSGWCSPGDVAYRALRPRPSPARRRLWTSRPRPAVHGLQTLRFATTAPDPMSRLRLIHGRAHTHAAPSSSFPAGGFHCLPCLGV